MGARLGVVSYLNTRPLVEALRRDAIDHDFELIYDVPSLCADRLHKGETDVALIPAAEVGRGDDLYQIVPNIGIVSNGPVGSVFIVLGDKDPKDIQTLALDSGSRTSVVLSQVILARQFDCCPKVFVHSPDVDEMLQKADAALVIGDPALELDLDRYRVLDLGELWTQITGLPFVYACWTGRDGAVTSGEVSKLIEAKEKGGSYIGDIAEVYASETNTLSPDFYAAYLTENILFDLGGAELEGLKLFYAYGTELGLIKVVPDIQFYS